jgi:hypothetical protein
MAAANSATVNGSGNFRRLPSGKVITGIAIDPFVSGDRYEWPRAGFSVEDDARRTTA